jgi:signal transduction histidine kinase
VTDYGKLRQILTNLIGNAIKFTPSGSVTVAVEADPATGQPLRIDVIDTGIGIPPDERDTVFEAFHQADSGTARLYGGTGLGLTISRSLCDLLGYGLVVADVGAGGTTFRILLGDVEPFPGPDLAPSALDRHVVESSGRTTP